MFADHSMGCPQEQVPSQPWWDADFTYWRDLKRFLVTWHQLGEIWHNIWFPPEKQALQFGSQKSASTIHQGPPGAARPLVPMWQRPAQQPSEDWHGLRRTTLARPQHMLRPIRWQPHSPGGTHGDRAVCVLCFFDIFWANFGWNGWNNMWDTLWVALPSMEDS